jgi:probable addiction module antidote protein
MKVGTKNYQDSLIEDLHDPAAAAAYLDAALEEGDRAVFLLAIKNVIEAQGGMSQIAREAGLNRENLYRPPLITKILAHVQRREALFDSTPRAPPDSLPRLNLT